jgi:biotin carboxyl carrier protein
MATYRVKSNGREFSATVVDKPGGGATVTIDGQSFEVESVGAAPAAMAPNPGPAPVASAAPRPARAAPQPAASASAVNGAIVAPIPGKIIALKVGVGEAVTVDQVVAILEAMKMENNVPSPMSGTVKEIAVSEGSEVSTGQTLMVIE